MARRNLLHFAEMNTMPNVFQFPENSKGKWAEFFKNNNPITLEVGCGTGNYTIELAKMYPERNFIGLDIKGARLWHGAKAAEKFNLPNVAFLRTIAERLPEYFEQGEISEMWITFPDPQPRKAKATKRLSSFRFLNLYNELLLPGAKIHFKTDNLPLFENTIEVFEAKGLIPNFCTKNLYEKGEPGGELSIKTTFEAKFLAQGLNICYLNCTWPDQLIPDPEMELKDLEEWAF